MRLLPAGGGSDTSSVFLVFQGSLGTGAVGMKKPMGHPILPDPPGFTDLTKAEQVRYLQALWDRIVDQPGELPVPESHIALAKERLATHRQDPSRAPSALEVLDRLSKRPG
jgi:hypothetical protein